MLVAHLGDLHLRNETDRHSEYRKVFDKIYKKLNDVKPDRIVIVGDLFESRISLTNEVKILSGELLNNLSKIAKVIITIGNHDLSLKNLNRVDSIDTIVKLINNKNVIYYNKSGFYKDGKITWVVYHHPDKQLDPWKNKIKDKNQIYIGLFHDPILNCINDLGYIFDNNKYKNISYFKNNDFLLLADIHKLQYFRKNKTAAYCGSTIQQNFGETVGNHGILLWNIKSKTDFKIEEVNIPNDHTFINFYIDEGFDYDDIILETTERIGIQPEFKVHWTDLSSNINTENERRIRKYIKDTYNTNKVKFSKTYIYTDIISSKMLSESLDLTNIVVHRKIFKEYLLEQGYNKKDIEEILKIDDIINDRLEIKEQQTNIEWKIDKLWFNNFKVFGDNNILDWRNLKGLIQISGENQQGKTTILDVITYILYGTTTTTIKREKFGDNRYINNKRNLDYCNAGAIIDVNGEKIIILRTTNRKWNKRKTELISCSSNLDYYSGEIIKPENKLTGERKTKTQDKLNTIIGDFKDFVRLSLTNADNLNELLSSDRSVFIDSIIRDAGYDIFEKKLKEYKDYKKNIIKERLIVDISSSEIEVLNIKNNIKEKVKIIKENKNIIKNYEIDLSNDNIIRDNLIKQLNKIDDLMQEFDITISEDTILNYKKKILDNEAEITIFEREILELPTKFDSVKINKLKVKLKDTNDKINKINEEISHIINNNTEFDSKIDKIKSKLRELRDKEIRMFKDKINDKEKEINNIENEKKQIVNDKISIIKDKLKNVELEKITIENKIIILKKDGNFLKKQNDEKTEEIEELKNNKFCPTCGRDYDETTPEHLEHIHKKIVEFELIIKSNNNKINELIGEFKNLTKLLPNLEEKTTILKLNKNNLSKGEYDNDILLSFNKLKNIEDIKEEVFEIFDLIKRLNNNDLSVTDDLKNKFNKGKYLLKKLDKDKSDSLVVIRNLKSELKLLNIENIEDDIYQEEKIKDAYELRKEKHNLKEKLILNIDNYNLKMKEIKQNIDKYKEYEKQIQENKETQIKINEIDKSIFFIKNNIGETFDNISNIKGEVVLKENEIKNISTRISKYIKQKKQEELEKEYQICISRDGIPTYLLKKSIHLINKELNELLTNVDFTLFFDDNLILKLSMDDRLDVSQNAIVSSGKERTFCALVLKIALRQINIKSRPNFIILDEIMGKLYEKSITEFIDLLDEIKNKIDNIIIIEHIHPINYDELITVSKNDKLISTLIVN